MPKESTPIDMELFLRANSFVEEALIQLKPIIDQSVYIGNYLDWPRIGWLNSGLPAIHRFVASRGPIDYKDAFQQWGGVAPLIDPDKMQSFHPFLDYFQKHSRIEQYFTGQEGTLNARFARVKAEEFVEYLVDRWLHLCNEEEYSSSSLLPLYLPLESFILSDRLMVDVIVPILFSKFDFDTIDLGGGIHIERMNDGFHIARSYKRRFATGLNDFVVSAATHALVLPGYEIENPNYWTTTGFFSESTAFPVSEIDAFFAAMRIVSGVDAGYAELLFRPTGWADGYTANLPPLEGTTVRAYPMFFENFYWIRDVSTFGIAEVQEWGSLSSKLQASDRKEVPVAWRRLNRCFLREQEEDSVIDATIGMEALLLTDNEKGEIVHRLSLRMGALSRLSDIDEEPKQFVQQIKKVYQFRSDIVHGRANLEKRRLIAAGERSDKIPTVGVAIRYLRMALRVLLDNPDYVGGLKIDEELLLGTKVAETRPASAVPLSKS